MISVLLLLLLALFLLYRYLSEHYSIFQRDGIPGPRPTFLLGNLGNFAKHEDPSDTFAYLTQKFGKVFGYFEGMTPSVVVSDPVMIEQILVKHFHQFDGRPRIYPFIYGSEHYLLQNINGAAWKDSHAAMVTALRSSTIRKMWPRLLVASRQYLGRLESSRNEQHEGIQISEQNATFFLKAVLAVSLDVDQAVLSQRDRNDLTDYMHAFHRSSSLDNAVVALSRVYPSLTPLFTCFNGAHKRLAAKHFRFITTRLEQERAKMKDNGDSKPPTNLLQHFLKATIASKDNSAVRTPFCEPALQGMVSSFFTGGIATAVSVLDFTVYCLCLNPDQQEKLRQEIDSLLGKEDVVTMDQVQGMEYLDMFINETLRHYPVAPGVARVCSEDCTVNGVKFRKGTAIRLMGSVQYRDPNIYPNPSHFRPERFSNDERSKRHLYSFIPFGNGPRMCVGKRLGLLLVKLAVVAILQNYRVKPCAGTRIPLPVAYRPFLCPRDEVSVTLEPLCHQQPSAPASHETLL